MSRWCSRACVISGIKTALNRDVRCAVALRRWYRCNSLRSHHSCAGAFMKHFVLIALALSLAAGSAQAQSGKASLKDAQGKDVGTAELAQLPQGVLIKLSLKGLPAGEHAFHVHG